MDNKAQKAVDWEAVEIDYRLGQLSLEEVADMHGADVEEVKAMALLEAWGYHDALTNYAAQYRYRLWVEEYLVAFDKKAANKAAGYAPNSSVDMLKRPEVRALIEVRVKQKAAQCDVNRDRVIEEYAKLAFFDPGKLFTTEGKPIPLNELPADVRAAIAGIDVTEGNGVLITKKYKLADRKAALDSLAKHLGMFTDKVEMTADVNLTEPDLSPNDAARRIAFVLAKAARQPD